MQPLKKRRVNKMWHDNLHEDETGGEDKSNDPALNWLLTICTVIIIVLIFA